MNTVNDVIAGLRDKNDKAAYEYAKHIGAESAESDKYLGMIPEFAEMLSDKSSYVRTRGFCLICNQARWADNGQIEDVFEKMSALLCDEKPTVVRQCLGALHEVALYRPEMTDKDGVKKLYQSLNRELQSLTNVLKGADMTESNLGKLVQNTTQNLDFLEQVNQMYLSEILTMQTFWVVH